MKAAPVVALVAACAGLRLRRVVVAGESMRPAFEPGDRLLVVGFGRLRAGQVVALRDPRMRDRILVKRVHRIDEFSVDVRGDNEGASTDSRAFGPVTPQLVLGRVVYRYHPSGRVGWRP